MNPSSKRQANHDGHAMGRHAGVLGESPVGLLAARVLSDHFDEVTLIERDVFEKPGRGVAALTSETPEGLLLICPPFTQLSPLKGEACTPPQKPNSSS